MTGTWCQHLNVNWIPRLWEYFRWLAIYPSDNFDHDPKNWSDFITLLSNHNRSESRDTCPASLQTLHRPECILHTGSCKDEEDGESRVTSITTKYSIVCMKIKFSLCIKHECRRTDHPSMTPSGYQLCTIFRFIIIFMWPNLFWRRWC